MEKCHKNLVHLPGDIHSTARRGSERLQSSLRPHKICFQLITSGEATVSNDSFVYFSFEKPFFCLCGMFLFCTEQHLLFSVFTHLMSTINLSASLHILGYLLSFPFIIFLLLFIERRYQQLQTLAYVFTFVYSLNLKILELWQKAILRINHGRYE